jgi:hypothetical protein
VTFAAFMSTLVRVRDEATGELRAPVLHPEEVRIVEALDAIDPATELRQFLTIVISWPRKAGKSFVSGSVAVYMLVFDRFATQREVLIQASTKDQGRSAVFLAAKRIVRGNPWLASRIAIWQDNMTFTDEAGVEHVMKVLPNDPTSIHGLNGSCTIYDEAWIHPNWEHLEGTSPSPARQCPLTVWASYAGLKSQRHDGNPFFDTLTSAQRGDDPRVFLSHISGREAARSVPWLTESWLMRLERQFAHVRSKFLRLGLNIWSTSDVGAFLTEEEIADAIDRGRSATVTIGPTYPTARIGVDLGLVKDRTAIIASDVAPDGRLVVLHVEQIQGTRAHPVSLVDVEARIVALARRLGTTHAALDRWQSAQMAEGLRRRGLVVQAVTCDAAWLDRAATNLKRWFAQRHIRIPAHPGLLEELEGLEAEELRRRDRVRFTATGSNHDDACVALCLSAERFAGNLRPQDTAIGCAKLPEIQRCRAADYLGRSDVDCPIANEGPSLHPGCRRCEMVQHVEPVYQAHLATGAEWISLGSFAQKRYAPNAWLRERRFAATMANFGF